MTPGSGFISANYICAHAQQRCTQFSGVPRNKQRAVTCALLVCPRLQMTQICILHLGEIVVIAVCNIVSLLITKSYHVLLFSVRENLCSNSNKRKKSCFWILKNVKTLKNVRIFKNHLITRSLIHMTQLRNEACELILKEWD